jgi:hypothetical protein
LNVSIEEALSANRLLARKVFPLNDVNNDKLLLLHLISKKKGGFGLIFFFLCVGPFPPKKKAGENSIPLPTTPSLFPCKMPFA